MPVPGFQEKQMTFKRLEKFFKENKKLQNQVDDLTKSVKRHKARTIRTGHIAGNFWSLDDKYSRISEGRSKCDRHGRNQLVVKDYD